MAQEKARPTRARTTKKEAAAKSAAKPTRKRAPVEDTRPAARGDRDGGLPPVGARRAR